MTTTELARARHQEAVTALAEWTTTNKQRTEMAVTVQNAALTGSDEGSEILSAYMKLCEVEMVQAGAAMMALSQCVVAFDAVHREKTGESIVEQLSAPGGTQQA